MLRITIDLVPFGDESRARRIGVGHIGNVSYPIGELSDYSFKFEEDPWLGRMFGPYVGEIRQWARNNHGAWQIVHAALNAAIADVRST